MRALSDYDESHMRLASPKLATPVTYYYYIKLNYNKFVLFVVE